jgi:hypothetical protein
VPFSFFPFYMMMFPAPSMGAADFLSVISNDTTAGSSIVNAADAPGETNRFLFSNQDRQFLEILYLKLTFLAQVFRQIMPLGASDVVQEIDLALDGIGVDLFPSGAGLPACWNFNVRILDAIGSFHASPFVPVMPQSPRLHFLGALWFRSLLVNSRQDPGTVFAEVGRLIDGLAVDQGADALEIETMGAAEPFDCRQIFWVPEPRNLPETWQAYWREGLRLGFQLVNAGLRTGVLLDSELFLTALDELRQSVKEEMFAGSVPVPAVKSSSIRPDRMERVLLGILEKWKATGNTADSLPAGELVPDGPNVDEIVGFPPPASDGSVAPGDGLPASGDIHTVAPPDRLTPSGDGWEQDIEETVIFSTEDDALPSEAGSHSPADRQPQASQWTDDIEATVVIRAGQASSPPAVTSNVDDMDQTIVVSPASKAPDSPSPDIDDGLAARMGQGASVSPSFSDAPEEDLEATVVLNAGRPTVPPDRSPLIEDDLAATIVQGEGDSQPSPPSTAASVSSSDVPFENGDDMEATVVISPDSLASTGHSPERSAVPTEEDLDATLIETPRNAASPGLQSIPPTPPAPPQPGDIPASEAAAPDNEDDDIMEQTIIIRSDVKKE